MHMIGEKMFKDNFVVALKVNGKVLREGEDSVKVPFNTEYSIFLKNLESKKAVVKISVDGEDVLDGKKLIVHPNSDLELEGYFKDTAAKNKFKFIEKTKQIEDFRGNRIDDSLIRVEFWFEKDKPIVQDVLHHHRDIYHSWWWGYPYSPQLRSPWDTFRYDYPDITWNTTGGGTSSASFDINSQDSQINCNYSNSFENNTFNEDGITVKGQEINQQFGQGYTSDLEEQSHVIILKIKGFVFDKKKVETPLFVNDKLICKICGTSNRSIYKHCTDCGALLE